jgi:hypothetical protein
MNSNRRPRHPAFAIVALTACAFTLIALRFSPNWIVFSGELKQALAQVSTPAERAAISKAVLSSNSERGYYVAKQTLVLTTEIENPNHKIVRWRLLMPAIGHILHLPIWLTLGLAQIGCLVFVATLAAIGFNRLGGRDHTTNEVLCLAIVGGASTPFFVSMGWLGYYDSWLGAALLAVAFARPQSIVVLACALAPWIDERFVVGLPLALIVRRICSSRETESEVEWIKREATPALALSSIYFLVRLGLGGRGGSQTIGEYLNHFVFDHRLTLAQRCVGAWEGLRVGWVLVIAGIIATSSGKRPFARKHGLLLATATIATALIGLFTVLDLSRAMVLVVPVVPLGWILLHARETWWDQNRISWVLASAALILPANHVIDRFRFPVDNFFTPSLPLLAAQTDIGAAYAQGIGLAKNGVEAVRWLRKAADCGYARAEKNLGVAFATGDVVAKDSAQAMRWYRLAADQGDPDAQNNLGAMYASGDGMPTDGAEAARWFRASALQGQVDAQRNLGLLFAGGQGVTRDPVQADVWLSISSARGQAAALRELETLEKTMTAEQIAEARRTVREMIKHDRLR